MNSFNFGKCIHLRDKNFKFDTEKRHFVFKELVIQYLELIGVGVISENVTFIISRLQMRN